MGVNPTTLGTAIANAIKAISIPAASGISDATREEIWQAVATEIDSEYSANAEVAPGGFLAPVGGGPVTGVGGPVS